MKRKTLSILVVVALLILAMPAGLAYAKAQPQNITFNLTGSWQEDGINPDTGEPTSDYYDASVALSGKISDKGGAKYLTPLHGTLAVNGTEYSIQVKQIKQSEPLYGDEMVINFPNGWKLVTVQTQGIVETNIQGKKFIGFLNWGSTTMYDASGGILFTSGGTDLTLSGIVDGKRVSISLAGDVPEIE